MTLKEFLEEIKFLSKPGIGFKPHKYVALLAVLQLVREHVIHKHRVVFNNKYKARFGELLKVYGGEGDRNRPHTPFFHLASTGFWQLVPNKGYESALVEAGGYLISRLYEL